MTKISKQELDKVALLARLELEKEQTDKYSQDLDEILNYVDQLEKAPTGELKPISQISNLENVMRKDEVKRPIAPTELLKNAPELKGRHIRVKKVL